MRNNEVVYIRMPPELVVALDDLAEANGVSRATIIVVLLGMAIGHVREGVSETLAT